MADLSISKPLLYLCKPDRTIIADLTNQAYNTKLNLKLSSVCELNFSLPYSIEYNHNLIPNPHISSIKYKFLIKYVDNIENQTIWFIIQKPTNNMQDTDSFEVNCYSQEYELSNKLIRDYSCTSKNLTSIMTDLLSTSTWSLGYVNASFDTKYRQYEVSSSTVLDAVLDCAMNTFGAIIKFDSTNKEINLYEASQIGVYNGLNLDYGKYLISMNQSIDVTDFCTCLQPIGESGLTINEKSITGGSKLYDFSYFLYPYSESSGGIILSESDYMSSSLCHALLVYNKKLQDNETLFQSYLTSLSTYQTEMTAIQNSLTTLQESLKLIQDDKDVAQSSNNVYNASTAYSINSLVIYNNVPYKCIQACTGIVPTNTSYWENLNTKESNKNTEITNKNIEITNKQNQINGVKSNITTLGNSLSWSSNFTSQQLLELNDFIIEKTCENQYITDAKDLLSWGKEQFTKINTPAIEINIDSINIDQYLDEDCQVDRGKLVLGNLVRISHDKFGIDVYAKIIEMTVSFDDAKIDLVISNIESLNRDRDKFVKLLNQSINTSNTVDMSKYKWDLGKNANDTITQVLNEIWKTAERAINAGVNESVLINERGITIFDPTDNLRYVRLTHGVIGITVDGGNTYHQVMDGSGVYAERLIGQIIAGSNLTITTENGDFLVNETGVSIKGMALKIIGDNSSPSNGLNFDPLANGTGLTITNSTNKLRTMQNATDGIKIQSRPSIITGEEALGCVWNNAVNLFYVDTNGNLINKGYAEIGSGNNIFKADGNGIYLGNATYANSPFRVSMSGLLVASNADISGTIRCSSLYINGIQASLVGSKIDDSALNIKKSTIEALNIKAYAVDAENITGTYLTGKTIQTSSTGERIIMDSGSIRTYNSSNQLHGVSLGKAPSGGQIYIYGVYDAGSFIGALGIHPLASGLVLWSYNEPLTISADGALILGTNGSNMTLDAGSGSILIKSPMSASGSYGSINATTIDGNDMSDLDNRYVRNMGGQNIRLQVYNGNLEVWDGSTLMGTIALG